MAFNQSIYLQGRPSRTPFLLWPSRSYSLRGMKGAVLIPSPVHLHRLRRENSNLVGTSLTRRPTPPHRHFERSKPTLFLSTSLLRGGRLAKKSLFLFTLLLPRLGHLSEAGGIGPQHLSRAKHALPLGPELFFANHGFGAAVELGEN